MRANFSTGEGKVVPLIRENESDEILTGISAPVAIAKVQKFRVLQDLLAVSPCRSFELVRWLLGERKRDRSF